MSELKSRDGQVNWLPPDPGTWELEDNHGSALPVVPLLDRLEAAFADGFRQTFPQLGLPLSHIELRHVNGWPYVSFFLHDVPRKGGDPPPAVVLKVLTRVHPGFRRRTKTARVAIRERRAQQLAQQWFDERGSWIRRLLETQAVDVDALTGDQFSEHLRDVADLTVEAATRHFALVPGSIPLGEWLARSEIWGLSGADARRAVMHGTPVHAEAGRRLHRIAAALGPDDPVDFDQIRAHGAEAADALDEYLAHHAWWATEDSVSASLVRDYPELVVHTIRTAGVESRKAGVESSPERSTAADVLARLRSQIPEADRADFDALSTDAQRAYAMLEDNSGILVYWATGICSHNLKRAAARLAATGRIEDTQHIWALDLTEIMGLLVGNATLSPQQVADRHQAWSALAELDPPPYLNGPPAPPPDPSVFPAPVARLVTALTTFLADKFNDANHTTGIGDRAVRGRAVVATDASDAVARIRPGDILVTTATTPAFNSILPIVGGIVVSQGGPSCHAAIVARELDVPALVGYAGAASIPDGTSIELDPVVGTVRLL